MYGSSLQSVQLLLLLHQKLLARFNLAFSDANTRCHQIAQFTVSTQIHAVIKLYSLL